MRLVNGTLELERFDLDHIQGNIDEERMSLQEAFEEELGMFGIAIKDVYSIQTNMGMPKEYIDLYCRIACEVKTGRKK